MALAGGLLIEPWMPVHAWTGAIRRQLRFSVKVTNPGSEELKDQVVWMYMPVRRTATQRLENISVSMAHDLSSDKLGHTIMALEFPVFAPLATRLVTVTADLSMKSTPDALSLHDPAYWLRAERHIEANDPLVRNLAAELRGATPLDTSAAIFAWVRQNLHYPGYIADDLGALHALTRRSGDCTEYAYLAAALARASGIPARMVGGFVSDRNAAPKAADYHNWAEVHVDGAWRLLDAQKGNWLTPAEHYVAFRVYSSEAVNPIGLAHRYRVEGILQLGL